MIKESAPVDLSGIAAKNVRITKPDLANAFNHTRGMSGAAELRSNLRFLRKLDLQEALDYDPGTAIYFGSTISLQGFHGGFLSYEDSTKINASSDRIIPTSRFTIWNCNDLDDQGVLRFGDAVWLQTGANEVLGAQFKESTNKLSIKRELQPAVINCRKENLHKAENYGRWIVLHEKFPAKKIGEQVTHNDPILLEQEWYFLSSQSRSETAMVKSKADDVIDKTNINLYNTLEDCRWKIHLVVLPSDDRPEERYRHFLMKQAKLQLHDSRDSRIERMKSFDQELRKSVTSKEHSQSLPKLGEISLDKLSSEMRLAGKSDDRLQELINLTKENEKFFSEIHHVPFLKSIYGNNSSIIKDVQRQLELATSMRSDMYSSQNWIPKKDRDLEPMKRLEVGGLTTSEIEKMYWDVAGELLLDTKTWSILDASMQKYYQLDREKKDAAALTIQNFFKRVMKKTFAWKREFVTIDKAEEERRMMKQLARHEVLMLQQMQAFEKLTGKKMAIANSQNMFGENSVSKISAIMSLREQKDFSFKTAFTNSLSFAASSSLSFNNDTTMKTESQLKYNESILGKKDILLVNKAQHLKAMTNEKRGNPIKLQIHKHTPPPAAIITRKPSMSLSRQSSSGGILRRPSSSNLDGTISWTSADSSTSGAAAAGGGVARQTSSSSLIQRNSSLSGFGRKSSIHEDLLGMRGPIGGLSRSPSQEFPSSNNNHNNNNNNNHHNSSSNSISMMVDGKNRRQQLFLGSIEEDSSSRMTESIPKPYLMGSHTDENSSSWAESSSLTIGDQEGGNGGVGGNVMQTVTFQHTLPTSINQTRKTPLAVMVTSTDMSQSQTFVLQNPNLNKEKQTIPTVHPILPPQVTSPKRISSPKITTEGETRATSVLDRATAPVDHPAASWSFEQEILESSPMALRQTSRTRESIECIKSRLNNTVEPDDQLPDDVFEVISRRRSKQKSVKKDKLTASLLFLRSSCPSSAALYSDVVVRHSKDKKARLNTSTTSNKSSTDLEQKRKRVQSAGVWRPVGAVTVNPSLPS